MKRKLGLLVIVALLLVGCASYERELVPPKVTVGGGNTVAVLFFDNYTDDYAISHELEQKLLRTLSEYYRVLDPAETEWALVRLGLVRGDTPNRDEAVRLGQMLGVDALILGEVTGYFAPVTRTQPYSTQRQRQNAQGKLEFEWETTQNTRVMVSFNARVVETRSGNVIHRQRAEGESFRDRKESVGWFVAGQQPKSWFLPGTNKIDVPDVREAALRQAANQFTADLMPTYVWHKVEQ